MSRGRGGDALLILTALLLPASLLFYDLAAFGLLNNGEGIYAEISREMLGGDDWIVPHLAGLPYVEKPPLLFWLLALSMKLFGVGDLAVRLVPAFAALLVCALTGGFGARLAGWRYGAAAALMLGTSFGVLLMGRVALTDGLLTAFLSAACLFAYLAVREARRLWWRLALASLALAILTKGLVALVLFGLIGVAHLAANERHRWRQHLGLFADPWAWALFLLLAVPWHWAVAAAQPQFAWFYFINEQLLRFVGLREPLDYYSGSPFYHLPRLALLALPWLPLAALATWAQRGQASPKDDLTRFLWTCVLVPLVFFSASSAKANYYTVVCLPPLALLMARPLSRWWQHGPRWRGMALLLPALLMAPTEFLLLQQARQHEMEFSARTMARLILQGEDLPVFIYRDFEDYSTLPFYLQRPVGSIDSRSQDLQFGLKLRRMPERFPTTEEFLRRTTPSYVVTLDSRLRHTPLPAALARGLEARARIGGATLYRHPGIAQRR